MARGVTFNSTYVAAPVCCPSRAAYVRPGRSATPALLPSPSVVCCLLSVVCCGVVVCCAVLAPASGAGATSTACRTINKTPRLDCLSRAPGTTTRACLRPSTARFSTSWSKRGTPEKLRSVRPGVVAPALRNVDRSHTQPQGKQDFSAGGHSLTCRVEAWVSKVKFPYSLADGSAGFYDVRRARPCWVVSCCAVLCCAVLCCTFATCR